MGLNSGFKGLTLIVQLHTELLVTVRDTSAGCNGAQGVYSCTRSHTLLARWTLSATKYKQKDIGDSIPPMPGLLTEKWKCKQIVSVTERRGLSTDEISLWVTCIWRNSVTFTFTSLKTLDLKKYILVELTITAFYRHYAAGCVSGTKILSPSASTDMKCPGVGTSL